MDSFEWKRMMDGELYNPYKVGGDSWEKVHATQKKFNESEFWKDNRKKGRMMFQSQSGRPFPGMLIKSLDSFS